jgi:CRP-like cAMP-binding protein
MKLNIDKFDYHSDKIIQSLNTKEQTLIKSKMELLKFKKGQLIFYESGIPTGIFLIKSGKAKIYKTGIYGRDQIFYLYKPGDLMGYHSLLCNEKYEDSCEAIEDCEVLFLNRTDFEFLLQRIQKLNMLFIQNMSHEFGVMVNTITVLAQKPLRERLALYLLILENRFKEKPNSTSAIYLSREDLANIIGTVRESLGRLLKEFKEEGLIEISGKNIKIKNKIKLNQLASIN